MSRRISAACLLVVLALAGCGMFHQDPNVAARNQALGIQTDSLPAGTKLGPDGLMDNGLLPPQWGNAQ